ncbi:hypothetical protein TNCV_3417711 [Trichonephila clavipes]|nr:hypothetical protein TNCV_3417711 [Trichonephila clavipes]
MVVSCLVACGERTLAAYIRPRHTGPSPGVMNVWFMVAERLKRHHTPVTTVDELRHRVEAAWSSVHVHAIQSLFYLMPSRISTVTGGRSE